MAVRIDINLPDGWGALTQEQLRFLLKSIAGATRRNRNRRFLSRTDYAVQTASVAEMLCFLEWGGLSVVCPYGDGFLFRRGKEEFVLSPDVVVSALSALEWTAAPPVEPVRLECVDGAVAIPADLSSGLPFDSWLACETLWQRYQASEDDALLQQMAAILYRKDDIRLDDAESLGVFYW